MEEELNASAEVIKILPMKTVTEHLIWGRDFLEGRKIESASLDTKILLSFATKISKTEFITHPETEIPHAQSELFQELVKRRGNNEPVAYLIHEKEFYGLSFYVNEHVLIPRPETEILIELFEKKAAQKNIRVCDVGTGSGAIAVTLKKTFPEISITAVDISADALWVAKMNAQMQRVELDFIESDLLDKVQGPFEAIVANLPYVPSSDIPGLSKDVQFEPKLALDSGKDGLDHYRKLLPQAHQKLVSGGFLLMEYGIHQTETLKTLLQSAGFSSIEVRKDFAGIDRIIFAQRT